MTEDSPNTSSETLGEYLRRQRRERTISFEELQRATRIPPRSLRAMEEDDHDALPAEAFARGFYLLYARHLGLDTEEVLKKYDSEHTIDPQKTRYSTPTKQGQQVNTMAARPSMATASAVGFILVLIIAAIALFSWYFSWNPASFISDQIHKFQEQTTIEENDILHEQELNPPQGEMQNHTIESTYFLNIDFLEDTSITIAIDDGLPVKELYTKGSTRSWYADEQISLILPATAAVNIFFNGQQVSLPEASDGLISLQLP